MGKWIDDKERRKEGRKEGRKKRKELRTVQFVLNVFEKNMSSLISKWGIVL